LIAILQHDDSPMTGPWREAAPGDPVLVRTVECRDSFWMIPVERPGKALGHIDVGPDGRVMGYAYLYQDPTDLSVCPPLATRIRAEEAQELAEDLLGAHRGATFSTPMFVHDGPHSRLAWMITVHVEGKLVSRVFVTPGTVYERRAGDQRPPSGRRGRPA
jgi:hypothetical protein